MGTAEIARICAYHCRRHLRRLLRANVCPVETTVRVGLGPPEAGATKRTRDPKNQFRCPGETLARAPRINFNPQLALTLRLSLRERIEVRAIARVFLRRRHKHDAGRNEDRANG